MVRPTHLRLVRGFSPHTTRALDATHTASLSAAGQLAPATARTIGHTSTDALVQATSARTAHHAYRPAEEHPTTMAPSNAASPPHERSRAAAAFVYGAASAPPALLRRPAVVRQSQRLSASASTWASPALAAAVLRSSRAPLSQPTSLRPHQRLHFATLASPQPQASTQDNLDATSAKLADDPTADASIPTLETTASLSDPVATSLGEDPIDSPLDNDGFVESRVLSDTNGTHSPRGLADFASNDIPDLVAAADDVPAVPAKRKIVDGMGPPLSEFRVSPAVIDLLAKSDITQTTEVQAGTFDIVYDGADVIAKSRTGTGKTLAFALPIMERLAIIRGTGGDATADSGGRRSRRRNTGEGPGCIVLAPTRELAKQVAREMANLGSVLGLSVECFYGGVGYAPQENALRRGVDVVVGTPGRVIDHLERGTLRLDSIAFAVLDEADEMLSMGFSQDVETVFERLPPADKRQVILFSATVPGWVKNLAAQYQKEDVVTFDAVTRGSMAATTVRHCAVRVPDRDEARASLLADIIAVYSGMSGSKNGVKATAAGPSRAIVFTQTKREADELATSGALDGCGAAVLHGDVSQKQREVTLAQFRKGRFQVLVATDVAARGLDISGVDVVVQYRVPHDMDAYIHRAGRTGRAGKNGTAVVMYSDREQRSIGALERNCKIKFERESAPAPELALDAAADVAIANMGAVDDTVVKHLVPKASELLQGAEDPEQVLATVLAIASRRTEFEFRSVLSGEPGKRTLHLVGSEEITPGFALRFIGELARHVGVNDKVGLIRQCRDGSTVLDVSADDAEKLVEASEDSQVVMSKSVSLSIATRIPALRDDDRRGGGRRDGGGRGRRGGGGGYGGGGYGGRGGGGYRDRGGYSDRGSYMDRGSGGGRGGYSRDGGYSRGGGAYGRDGDYGGSRYGGGGRRGSGGRFSRDNGRRSSGSYGSDRSSDSHRTHEFLSDDF